MLPPVETAEGESLLSSRPLVEDVEGESFSFGPAERVFESAAGKTLPVEAVEGHLWLLKGLLRLLHKKHCQLSLLRKKHCWLRKMCCCLRLLG